MTSRTVTGTGIFTSSLRFIRQHFWDIVAISAIPVLMDLFLITGLAALEAQQHAGHGLDSQTFRIGARISPPQQLAALLSYLIILWMSVRLYRYRLRCEFRLGPDDFTCVFRTLVYSVVITGFVGIAILAFAGLTFGMLVGFNSVLGAGVRTSSADFRVALAVLAVAAVAIGSAVYLVYMTVRFSIALPGVAIGGHPRILSGMWPLGRGVAWALMGWWLLLAADAVIATLLLILLTAAHPEFMKLAVEIPYLLFNIASAVLFAEAYAQLKRATP